jgi:hypothetical protein
MRTMRALLYSAFVESSMSHDGPRQSSFFFSFSSLSVTIMSPADGFVVQEELIRRAVFLYC